MNCAVSGMNMRAKGRKRNDYEKRKESEGDSSHLGPRTWNMGTMGDSCSSTMDGQRLGMV